MGACRQIHIKEGTTVVVGKNYNPLLNDSAMIMGRVFSSVDQLYPEHKAKIWIEVPYNETFSDTTGFYQLMLAPGTYNLKYQGDNRSDNEIWDSGKIDFLPNEVTEINFYLGSITE